MEFDKGKTLTAEPTDRAHRSRS